MATEILVEDFVDDGGRIVDRLVRDGFDVTVAAWLKSGDEGLWRLYIASPMVDSERPGEAYAAAYGSLNKISGSSVTISDIVFTNDASPIARDILAIRERYPAGSPIRFLGGRLGQTPIEEARVYPRRDESAEEAIAGLVRFLRDHRGQGLGIDPRSYKRPDGQPFDDERELIDYWTELLDRMPPLTPSS